MLTARIYAQAQETPEKTALIVNHRTVSYRLFAGLIEAARGYLRAQGVGSEGVAVLPSGSMLNTWVLGLALRSLGVTILVIHSEDRIGSLDLPEMRYVVAAAGEHGPGLERLCADAGWRFIGVPAAVCADAAQAASADLPDLGGPGGGFIRMTSGTTGIYKKFLVDPALEQLRLRNRQDIYELSRDSVFNAFGFGGWTGIGYEGSCATWDLGGTVVIHQGPKRWEAFAEGGITHANLIPRVLTELLGAPPDALRRDDTLRLIVGGGPLSEELAEAAKARLTTQLCTVFASSEAGPFALTPIRQTDDLRWHRIAKSREVQIVDEAGNILPAGQSGQIRVRTLGNPTGYLGDAAASRAFFREGYFYPGDLGVLRADGRLAVRGRVSEVINLAGAKIAVAPIEEELRRLFEVGAVCVLSSQNSTAAEEVHVMIETARPIDRVRMAAALAGALKGAPIGGVHFVATFPRNDMGKIQRHELAAMAVSATGGNRRQRRAATKFHRPARRGATGRG